MLSGTDVTYITSELTDKIPTVMATKKLEREHIWWLVTEGENGIIDITAGDFISVITELKQVLDNKNRQSR